MENIFHYYGLDWLDASFSVLGIYLLGKQNKLGFICNCIGAVFGLTLFILFSSYPFIALNIFLITLNLSGYRKWKSSTI